MSDTNIEDYVAKELIRLYQEIEHKDAEIAKLRTAIRATILFLNDGDPEVAKFALEKALEQ